MFSVTITFTAIWCTPCFLVLLLFFPYSGPKSLDFYFVVGILIWLISFYDMLCFVIVICQLLIAVHILCFSFCSFRFHWNSHLGIFIALYLFKFTLKKYCVYFCFMYVCTVLCDHLMMYMLYKNKSIIVIIKWTLNGVMCICYPKRLDSVSNPSLG